MLGRVCQLAVGAGGRLLGGRDGSGWGGVVSHGWGLDSTQPRPPAERVCLALLLLLLQAQAILKALPSLVDIEVAAGTELTVCGDTHGQ